MGVGGEGGGGGRSELRGRERCELTCGGGG